MKISHNIEYFELVIKTEIRKIKAIIGYVVRNKSFKVTYYGPWYSDVCRYFRITPKEALIIAASKNRQFPYDVNGYESAENDCN